MPVPLDPRWVPVSELPLDLLNTLRDNLAGEPRHFGVLTARPEAPNWARILGFLALGIGVLVALVNPAVEGFESFWRYGMLISGAVLVAIYYSYKRASGYASNGQRLLVGTTSLVLVDAWNVRVFPGEKLVVQDFGSIVCEGETVCQGPHATPWRDALKRAVELAKKDPAARDADRWRIAAQRAKAPNTTAPRTGPRLVPRLVAVGLAATAAVAVEAGPLHLRAEPLIQAREGARQRSERYYREQQERYAQQQREATERRTREAAEREERLRNLALTGTMADARALLANPGTTTDAVLTQVRERLSTLCTEAYPLDTSPRVRGRAVVLSHLLLAACNDPEIQIRYRPGEGMPETIARQVAVDVTASTNDMTAPILVESGAWAGTTGVETLQAAAVCTPVSYADPSYDPNLLRQAQNCAGTAQLLDVDGSPVRGASYPVQVRVAGVERPRYPSGGSYGGGTGNTYVPRPGSYGSGTGSYRYRYGTH